jgi:hypothetical protein
MSGVTPFLLSRDYEDYLDWQENQRRDRTKRNRGRRIAFGTFGFTTLFATAFAFAGALLRRR